MLSESDLARLIVSWRNQQGKEIKDKTYVPIESSLRTEMYKNLIKTLIELHHYTQEDFEGNTYRRVMDASISHNSEKKEQWRQAATADWFNALDAFYPQTLLVHDTKDEPEKPKRKIVEKVEYTDLDPRLLVDNPVDASIFAGLPPVEDPVDEDFMKLLKELSNE